MLAPTLATLETDLKKKQDELNTLSWFQNKEVATKAVIEAQKKLDEMKAIEARHAAVLKKNPNYKRFEELFPDGSGDQQPREKFDREKIHAERAKREAKAAADLEALRQQRAKHAGEWNVEIQKRNDELAQQKKPPLAMLFNIKDKKVVGDAQYIERNNNDGRREGHLSVFNRLQQAYVADKKTPSLSPAPHHDPVQLRAKQDAVSAQSVKDKRGAPVKAWNEKNARFLAENRKYLQEQQEAKTAALKEKIELEYKMAADYRSTQQQQTTTANVERDARRLNILGIEKRPKTAAEIAEFAVGRDARLQAREVKRAGFFASLTQQQRAETIPENRKTFDADKVALNSTHFKR